MTNIDWEPSPETGGLQGVLPSLPRRESPTTRRRTAMKNIALASEALQVAAAQLIAIGSSQSKLDADKVKRAIESVRQIGDIS
jgi:hypothetical protein